MILCLCSRAVRAALGEPRAWLALLAALLVSTTDALAQEQSSVTVAWDPGSGSGIAGYRLYVGGASRTYTNIISVKNATSATVPGLTRGNTYFFAATSYNTDGQESGFSKELEYTIPLGTSSPPGIELTSPANGAIWKAPATINLTATVTTGGQTIKQVEFYSGAGLLGVATEAPYTLSWDKVGAGNYAVRAVAVFQSGSTLSSAVASVAVVANQPPPEMTFAADSGITAAPLVANGGTLAQAIETSVTNGGLALYTFYITNAGNYTVSAVVSAPNEGQNSFYVNIDAEPTDPLMIWDIPLCTRPIRHTVSWRGDGGPEARLAQYSPKIFSLSAGMHQLIIRGREANTRLGAITIAAVPPRLQIHRGPGGSVVLSGTGQPTQTYKVLGSENLITWRAIGTVTADPLGAFEFSDPAASGLPSRMYRLLSITVTPVHLRIAAAAGGLVALSAVGPAGQTYTLQRSQDLQNWSVVGTMTLNESGQGRFTDFPGTSLARSFYRLQGQ